MEKMRYIAATCVLLTIGMTAQGIPQRRGLVFGTFSSLRFVEESGDLLGEELIVLPNMNSAYVVFQCAEGNASEPVLVPAVVKGTKIQFSIDQKDGMCNGSYVGIASAKGIILKNGSGNHPEFLLRRRSYWAQ